MLKGISTRAKAALECLHMDFLWWDLEKKKENKKV